MTICMGFVHRRFLVGLDVKRLLFASVKQTYMPRPISSLDRDGSLAQTMQLQ